jgi:hypothetical protein
MYLTNGHHASDPAARLGEADPTDTHRQRDTPSVRQSQSISEQISPITQAELSILGYWIVVGVVRRLLPNVQASPELEP